MALMFVHNNHLWAIETSTDIPWDFEPYFD